MHFRYKICLSITLQILITEDLVKKLYNLCCCCLQLHHYTNVFVLTYNTWTPHQTSKLFFHTVTVQTDHQNSVCRLHIPLVCTFCLELLQDQDQDWKYLDYDNTDWFWVLSKPRQWFWGLYRWTKPDKTNANNSKRHIAKLQNNKYCFDLVIWPWCLRYHVPGCYKNSHVCPYTGKLQELWKKITTVCPIKSTTLFSIISVVFLGRFL